MNSIKKYMVVVSAIWLLLSCTQDKRYSWKVKNAFKDLNEKKYESAIAYATDAIEINSEKSIGWILRGRAFYEIDKFNNSLKDLKHGITIDPKNTTALYYIGLCSYDLDEYDSSIYYFNEAIESKGSDSIYIEFNDRFLKNTFDENIDMSSIRFFRGLCYYYKDQFSDAFKDLSFSADEGYNTERCFFYMGLIALKTGRNDLACKYLNLSLDKGYTEAEKYLPSNCR